MANNTLQQNITNTGTYFTDVKNALIEKGVNVPDGTPASELGNKIRSISTGISFSINDASYLFNNGARKDIISNLIPLISESNTTTNYMFNNFSLGAGNILDLSNFKTTNVSDMSYMFNNFGCQTLILNNDFTTANVLNMNSMFYAFSSVDGILNLSSFNTAKVNNMSDMFFYCYSPNINTSSFNTSLVQSMESMFSYSKITSLDMSNFNTSSCTTMWGMFNGCSQLTSVVGLSIDGNIASSNWVPGFSTCYALNTLLFKSGSTFGSNSTQTILTLDLTTTSLNRTGLINMINSCGVNTSGKTRKFKTTTTVYNTLTTDDIALFTAKNYTVVSA